jgi:hypothetical protein
MPELDTAIEIGLQDLHEVGLEELNAGRRNCFTCLHYYVNRRAGTVNCRKRAQIADTLAEFANLLGRIRKRGRSCKQWEGDGDD